MIVYIAGPLKGNIAQNINDTIYFADQVIGKGHTPYVPHTTHLWDLISPRPAEFWYEYDKIFLAKCDCVLRLFGASTGADGEVRLANELGIPVYLSVEDLP